MSIRRMRVANTCASEAYRRLGQSARTLTLMASVYAKDPLSADKAKSYLEKALKLDSMHLDAVYCLCSIHWQKQHFDKGIEL